MDSYKYIPPKADIADGYIETEIVCLDCSKSSFVLFSNKEMPTWIDRHLCRECNSKNTKVSRWWFKKKVIGKRHEIVHKVSYNTRIISNEWGGQGMADSYTETHTVSRGYWTKDTDEFVIDRLWFVLG